MTQLPLFRGAKETQNRKKAKEFFKSLPNLNVDSRKLRQLRSLMGSRLTAFVDSTFVEGAKSQEKIQDSAPSSDTDKESFSSAYKDVKTLRGTVMVYLPQKYTNMFFHLGKQYQSGRLTRNRTVELADDAAKEVSELLKLDRPIYPLAFLRVDDDDTADDSNADQE